LPIFAAESTANQEDAAFPLPALRGRELTGTDLLPPLDGVPYNCKTYGSITLTDQQPVSVRFSSPCPLGSYPCTFGLKRLTVILAAIPPHPYFCSYTNSWWSNGFPIPFGNDCPVATVSFKVELGRYYKNPSAGRIDVEVQTTVWTRKFLVRGDDQVYNLSLQGLFFSVWNPATSNRIPGDMKLIITPYIHYTDVVIDALRDPAQIQWKLSKPSWSGTSPWSRFEFVKPRAFQMLPGCPASYDSELIYDNVPMRERMLAGEHIRQEHERMETKQARLLKQDQTESADKRELTNVAPSCSPTPKATTCLPTQPPWYPDVCCFKDQWTCVPAFPALDLEGLLPCWIVFNVLSNNLGDPDTLFRGIAYEPATDPGSGEVVAPSLNTLIISASALPALPPPPSPRPEPPVNLLPWPPFYPLECPDYKEEYSKPFITSAFGRYIGPDCDAINTRAVANTTGPTDILILFRAPCHRCSLYMRKFWLPLAKDLSHPACCNRDNKLSIHSYVGLWKRGYDCQETFYPVDEFDCTSSNHPNGAHTEVCLSDTHLEQTSE
jgi:hypothetical protein